MCLGVISAFWWLAWRTYWMPRTKLWRNIVKTWLVDCVFQFSWRALILEIDLGHCSPLRKFAFGAFWKCSLTCLCGSSRRKKVAELFIDFVFSVDPQTLTGCFFQQQMTQWGTSGENANAGTPCVRGSTNQAAFRDNCAWNRWIDHVPRSIHTIHFIM